MIQKQEQSNKTDFNYKAIQNAVEARKLRKPLCRYRNKLQIVHSILKTLQDKGGQGETKTRLMYRSLLSYSQLKDYLYVMISEGLVVHNESYGLFAITQKGIEVMKKYDELAALMPELVDTDNPL